MNLSSLKCSHWTNTVKLCSDITLVYMRQQYCVHSDIELVACDLYLQLTVCPKCVKEPRLVRYFFSLWVVYRQTCWTILDIVFGCYTAGSHLIIGLGRTIIHWSWTQDATLHTRLGVILNNFINSKSSFVNTGSIYLLVTLCKYIIKIKSLLMFCYRNLQCSKVFFCVELVKKLISALLLSSVSLTSFRLDLNIIFSG